MAKGAHVGSVEAIGGFRAAFATFVQEAREALGSQDLEVRRTIGWLQEDEPNRWQQEVRRADLAVVQAKIELERCRVSKMPGGEARSCLEERKAYDRAKRRREFAEDMVVETRRYGRAFEHEADEYAGRASQLSAQIEAFAPQALAMLDGVLDALDAYRGVQNPALAALDENSHRPVAPTSIAKPMAQLAPSSAGVSDPKIDETAAPPDSSAVNSAHTTSVPERDNPPMSSLE